MVNIVQPGVVGDGGLEVHERRLRALARPTRAVRTALASSLWSLVQRAIKDRERILVRAVIPDGLPDTGYVFVRFPHVEQLWPTYDEYRKERQSALLAYVTVLKMRNPELAHVVGIASEFVGPSSHEIQYIAADEWDEEASEAARRVQAELGIFASAVPTHGNLVEEAFPAGVRGPGAGAPVRRGAAPSSSATKESARKLAEERAKEKRRAARRARRRNRK
jgi:hypothetical protein